MKGFEFGICFYFADFFKMFLILFFFGKLNVDSIRVIISRKAWMSHKLCIWNQHTKFFG